jgi:hypothetical protein
MVLLVLSLTVRDSLRTGVDEKVIKMVVEVIDSVVEVIKNDITTEFFTTLIPNSVNKKHLHH